MTDSRQVKRRAQIDSDKRKVRRGKYIHKSIASLDIEGAAWVEANKHRFFRLQGAWFTEHDYDRVPVTLIRAVPGASSFEAVVLVEVEDGTQLEVYYKELDVSDTPLKSWSDEYDDIMKGED